MKWILIYIMFFGSYAGGVSGSVEFNDQAHCTFAMNALGDVHEKLFVTCVPKGPDHEPK